VLAAGDDDILRHVADGVFDFAVDPHLTAEFLADPRHHLVVAIDQGIVVGMVSGVHYLHPDKRPELDVGRRLNCTEAWVLTDRANPAAMRTYETAGGLPKAQAEVVFEFRLGEPFSS